MISILAISFLVGEVKMQDSDYGLYDFGFNRVSFSSKPKIVSGQSNLTFTMQFPTNYATNDKFIFYVPKGYFIESTALSGCISNSAGFSITSCVSNKTHVVLQIAVSMQAKIFSVILTNYINPYSTTPVYGLMNWYYNSAGTLKGNYSDNVLQSLEADNLMAATLTPLSQEVGAANVKHRWTIQLKNTMFSDSKVQIYYPKWNPQEGGFATSMILRDTPLCFPFTNTIGTITCSFDQATDILLVENLIETEVPGGSTIEFDVDSFQNPYSGKPRDGFWVRTTDSLITGLIDSSQKARLVISFNVTDFTSFQTLKLTRVDTQNIVGELSIGRIDLTLSLPIDADCRLEIRYPSDMPLTTNMTKVDNTGLIARTNVAPTYTNLTNNTFYLEGCLTYQTSIKNTITMYYMKNKGHVMDTESFEVYLWALNRTEKVKYPIAKQVSGVYFKQSQFTTGSITTFSLATVDSNEVQNNTRYVLSLLPVHDMPQSSMITIRFPYDMNLTLGACNLTEPLAPMVPEGICTVDNNMIIIRDPYGPGTFTANPNGLRFMLNPGGNNSLSEKDSGTYYVDTYAIVNEVPYQIDTNSFTSVFKPVRGSIRMNVFLISSYETYASPVNYTFEINPTKIMPPKSILTIEIPPVITVLGDVVPKCTYAINGQIISSTAMETLSVSESPILQDIEMEHSLKERLDPHIMIRISDMLDDMWFLDPGTPFYITCEGFRNPRTTRETATFKINVTDANGYYLEDKLTDITTQMLTRPNIPSLVVEISNYTNGDSNTYDFTTSSPLPLFNGDILQFEFPIENRLPTPIVCVPLGDLSLIECVRVGDFLVHATMTFKNAYIEVNTLIHFQLLDVENPPDTRESSPFTQVLITDPLAYQLTQYIGRTTVQTQFFAIVQQKTLSQTDYGVLRDSDYIFTYKTINRMPAGSAFLITFPITVQPPRAPEVLETCSIQYNGQTYDLNACEVHYDILTIKVKGGFNTEVEASAELKITLGLIITPISQLQPGKFTLKAFVNDNYFYTIDEIPEGLIPIFECDHPCRTCALPERGDCTSCKTNDPTEILVYLELMRCIDWCPDGKFGNLKNDKICEFCPDECLTCWNETVCNRCKPNSRLTELLNDWCYFSCPPNLCPINFKCSSCYAPPFSTLSVVPSPSTVNYVSRVILTATIANYANTYFEQNDIMWLLIPEPGYFIRSNDTSEIWRVKRYQDYFSDITLCQSLTEGIAVDYCTLFNSRVMMKLNVTLPAINQAVFSVGNFQNPSDTTPIPFIQIFLTKADDTPKAVFTTTIMEDLTPEKIDTAFIAPSSNVIGSKSLQFTVRFTNNNTIETNHQIWVRFPFWNPRSPVPQHMIRNVNPTCVGVKTVKTSLTCKYDQATRTLKVTNPVEENLTSQQEIEFTVDNFQNPYNSIIKTGFQITTMETLGAGKIDESAILSITVTDFAALEVPTIQRGDSMTTIGEFSSLILGFQINLPIDPFCRLRIFFPADQPLTADLTDALGTNLFSKTSGFTEFSTADNFLELAGCPTYAESEIVNRPNTIKLSRILNIEWVKDTLPFKLQLFTHYEGVNYKIAEILDPNMKVSASTMLSTGPILMLQVAALDSRLASELTRFKITIKPVHRMPPNNKIKIKFPTGKNKITLQPIDVSSCKVSSQDTNTLVDPILAQCEVDTTRNEVSAINVFGSQDFPKDGPVFSFSVSAQGRNPDKTCGYILFEAATFAVIDGADYAIDVQSFDSEVDFPPRFDPFLLTADVLNAAIQRISSTVASQKPVSYFFTVTPSRTIPQNGYLQVWMPSTVRLPLGVNHINCTLKRGAQEFQEFAIPYSLTPLRFDLREFVKSGPSPAGSSFTIECDGIWNPRTLEETESIELSTRDTEMCAIELRKENLKVKMTELPSFESVIIQNDQFQNGGYANFTFELSPRIVMYNDDSLQLTFPPETTLSPNPVCEGSSIFRNMTCTSPSHNVLKIEFFFEKPILAEKFMIFFRVFNVRNSPNTKITEPFSQIQALDSKGRPISLYSSVGPQLINTKVSIAKGSLKQDSNERGGITDYTITYTNVNRMDPGYAFVIEYPNTVQIPKNLLKEDGEMRECSVAYLGHTYQMSCVVIEASSQIIVKSLETAANIAVPENTEIKIRLGRIRNPVIPLSIAGFAMTTFTDSSLLYVIDRIVDNLIPKHICEYPCATCLSQVQRTTCLSCYTTETAKYFYSQKCLSKCPYPLTPNEINECVQPTIGFETEFLGASNYQAGHQPTQYSLAIKPTKLIPEGSVIKIQFPSELSLATNATNIVCDTYALKQEHQGFNNTGRVTLTSAVPPLAITIDRLFDIRAKFDQGSKIIISCDQIRNPSGQQESGTFTVSISHPTTPTFTVSSGMTVRMLDLPTNTSFKMEPFGRNTGSTGDYRLTLTSGQPLASGTRLRLHIPADLTLPDPLSCAPISSNLEAITCTQDQVCLTPPGGGAVQKVPTEVIVAQFTFRSTVNPPRSEVVFSLAGVKNPDSTRPIELTQPVEIYDENGLKMREVSEKPPTFSMKVPAEVTQRTLVLDNYEANAKTGFTLTYTTVNRLVPMALIVISYPASAEFVAGEEITCAVTVNAIVYVHICRLDRIRREITFQISSPSGTVQSKGTIPKGSSISLIVKEFLNRARSLGVSKDQFTLKTYLDQSRKYGIDQIQSGLPIYSCIQGTYPGQDTCNDCVVPCLTCTSPGTVCQSCDTSLAQSSTSSPFLYQNECYKILDCNG